MKIKVFGPNLSGGAQHKGEFHVHATDCGDCKHYGAGKYGGDGGYEEEAETTTEVAKGIYPPGDFGYDPNNPDDMGTYEADQWYAPCIQIEKGTGKLSPTKK